MPAAPRPHATMFHTCNAIIPLVFVRQYYLGGIYLGEIYSQGQNGQRLHLFPSMANLWGE
jgi:hypothetical protein